MVNLLNEAAGLMSEIYLRQVSEESPRLRAKIAALTGLTASWILLYATMDRPFVVTVAGVSMALVALYIVTRPSPSRASSEAALQNEA